MPAESILVVDDNPQNLKLARLVLKTAGYVVQTANDAEEAQAALAAQLPALILMDLQLPGMDGLELTRQLKADPARCHVPILALTAYAMKGDEDRALAAGCDAYLAKPFEADVLISEVQRLIAGVR